MRFIEILSYILVLITLTNSCDYLSHIEDEQRLILNDTLQYRFNQTRCNNQLCVVLDSVLNDSRCPLGVMCFWEGNAQVKLIVSDYDNDTAIILNTHGSILLNNIDTIGDYALHLIDLKPWPEYNKPLSQQDYSALIAIKAIE